MLQSSEINALCLYHYDGWKLTFHTVNTNSQLKQLKVWCNIMSTVQRHNKPFSNNELTFLWPCFFCLINEVCFWWNDSAFGQEPQTGQRSQRVFRDRLVFVMFWSFYGIFWGEEQTETKSCDIISQSGHTHFLIPLREEGSFAKQLVKFAVLVYKTNNVSTAEKSSHFVLSHGA